MTGYERELDLERAAARVRFDADGIHYERKTRTF